MARKKKQDADPNEVLAEITPNAARRGAAVGMAGGLGALILLLVVSRPQGALGPTVFLVLMALASLWLAGRIWRSSGRTIELTRSELREVDGRVLVRLEDLAKVDRGLFAFKPAGGFLLKTKTPLGRVYAPGLWWRLGRTVAVGGTTKRAQAKEVADLMTVMIIERDGGL